MLDAFGSLFPFVASWLCESAVVLAAAVGLLRAIRTRTRAEQRSAVIAAAFIASAALLAAGAAGRFAAASAALRYAGGPVGGSAPGITPPRGSAPPRSTSAAGDGAAAVQARLRPAAQASPRIPAIAVPAPAAAAVSLIWLAGTLAALLNLARRRRRLEARIAALRPCRDADWIRALEAARAEFGYGPAPDFLTGAGPFVCRRNGRAVIVAPAAQPFWSDARKRSALLHEIAHLKRRDPELMAWLETVACPLWCVPLAGFLLAELGREREEACDDLVLAAGADPAEYASLLLDLNYGARFTPVPGAQGVRGGNDIIRRIDMMIDKDRRRCRPRSGPLGLEAIFALAALGAGLACLPPIFAQEAPRPAGKAALTAEYYPAASTVELAAATGGASGGLLRKSLPLEGLPLAMPVTAGYRVSLAFGEQTNPFTGSPFIHRGIDLSAFRSGDPALATADGLVVWTGDAGDYGKAVYVRSGNVLEAYFHLGKIAVAVGRRVKLGETVGEVGATGVSTGPHLHYAVYSDIGPQDRFDGDPASLTNGVWIDPAALFERGRQAGTVRSPE
jgi:murein DD-endopeptidase MepM/ murein hydrolase activator NlpD